MLPRLRPGYTRSKTETFGEWGRNLAAGDRLGLSSAPGSLPEGPVRGYVCELYQGHYQLPELGPIGSNGLANSRDSLDPVVSYDEDLTPWTVVSKYNNTLFSARQATRPLMSLPGMVITIPTSTT